MKQHYPTIPGFTFRQQPFGFSTALFLLFFLLNITFGFGQGDCTITSTAPDPTDETPILLDLNFEGPINRDLVENDFIVTNGEIGSFERGIPEFQNSNSSDINEFPVIAGLTDFIESGYTNPFNEEQRMAYLSEKISRSVISIDVDSDGDIFYLTFADGVFQYFENDADENIISGDEFAVPLDMVIDNNDRIVVADPDNLRVRIFDQNGILDYDIGGGFGNGSGDFYGPSGLAVNEDNILYVADQYSGEYEGENLDLVKLYDLNSSSEDYIRQYGFDILDDPYRIAVDRWDNVYVSDSGNSGRVIVFNDQDQNVDIILSGSEDSPGSIITDDFGYVYIINYNGDLTFSDIYVDPLVLINNYEEIQNGDYQVDVYSPFPELNPITTFSHNLNLPVDLALDNCNNIFVNDLELGGQAESILDIQANFNFDLEKFKRNDNFTAEVTPEEEGEVVVTLNSDNDFFPCDPQPECSFSIDYETEEELDPIVNCPGSSILDELELGENCNYILPEIGQFIETENFENEDLLVVDENISDNILTVEVEVLDGEELIETCELRFELVDQTPPTISCPENITREIPAGEDSVVINYNLPEVSDNCSENLAPVLSDGLASGSEFEEGEYFIEFEVTDDADLTARCEFRIIVTREEPAPYSFQCIEEITVRLGEEAQNSFVTEIPTSEFITSDTSNLDFELTNQQFTCENIGTNSRTIKATNSITGEQYSCEVMVTVEDVGAPLITCPAEPITTNLPDGGYEVPNFFENNVSDNCNSLEELELVQDVEAGSIINTPGTYTINLTATDVYDNVETCEVIVILEENNPAAPELDCPQPQILDLEGNCEIELPNYIEEANFTDGAIVTQDPEPGTSVSQNQTIELTASLNGESISCGFQLEVINPANDLSLSCPYEGTHEIEIPASQDSTIFEFDDPEISGGCGEVTLLQTSGPTSGEFFTEGNTTVTFTATDEADNSVSCSFTVRVEREGTPTQPSFSCSQDGEIPDLRLDENCEIDIPDYAYLVETQNFTPRFEQTEERFDETLYVVVEIWNEATDELVGDCSFSVSIVDLIPPQISCPEDQIENFNPEQGFVVPNYENMANFSDNCGEVSFRQEPAAGEIIYETTSVRLTAFDERGLGDSCSFQLILTDSDVLNIFCQIDQNVTPEENCSFTLPDYRDTATVSLPGATITQTPPEGTVITENTQIKLTASLDGETDDCYFMVNLVDEEAPVANCVSGFVVNLDENGTANISPEDLDNNSTDNCGIASMALSQTNFTSADIGQVPVTLTVRDEAGNEDSCETIIEVIEEESGDFQCRENVVVNLNENGEANLSLQDLYTGDASGVDLEANQLDFNCSDLGVTQIQLDYSGEESGSCMINVEVRDGIPPVVITNIVELTLDGSGFAYLEENDVLAEDNCSETLIYEFSKSVFTCKDVGSNTVSVQLEDANGNVSQANIEVRVRGESCDIPEGDDIEFLFLYPNPNDGVFTIATPQGMFIESVRVFDSRGRYIMQQDYNANARFYRMTIQGVAESVYTLQIFTNEGTIIKRAIIKR
ncbi:HYR domain-containing protein [Salegentibacter sp. Hel_I_6]|uniref:HYR domain-containing protein n=1 Tax=Salegentibacter sp. Hel_I_6 TaxID=1250278 RepID=UPI0005604DAD|nr:HYR domain-containing protein [Salegentibacter sp. Hel_I_6]